MIERYVQRTRLCGLVLPLLLAALASPAAAGEPALLQLLEVLRSNGTISDEAYAALAAAARTDAGERATPAAEPEAEVSAAAFEPQTAHVSAAAPEPPDEDGGPEVRFDAKGLTVESADGDFEFNLGGRIHVDAAFYGNQDGIKLGNGTEVRRARLSLAARFFRDWDTRFAVDFAGDEVSLKSVYLSYQGFDFGNILVGNFKEPFSQKRLESSNDTLLMERPAPVTAFAPGRHVGASFETHGRHWTFAGGVFGGDAQEDEIDESGSVTARVTVAPLVEEGRVVHLGLASSYRWFDEDIEIRFRERWETHVEDLRLVDTGDIADLNSQVLAAAEFAVIHGPVWFQSEYLMSNLDRRDGTSDLLFQGAYAQLGWVITGEARPYKASRGLIRDPIPRRGLMDGGPGAWELGVRYSWLDLSDAAITGGAQQLLSAGLIWYPNRNIRFMADFVRVMDLDRPGSVFDGANPFVFQLRSQLAF